jgi:hypothetical protein
MPRPRFRILEMTLGTHCTGGWVGPMDTEARGKILSPLPGIEPRPVVRTSQVPGMRAQIFHASYEKFNRLNLKILPLSDLHETSGRASPGLYSREPTSIVYTRLYSTALRYSPSEVAPSRTRRQLSLNRWLIRFTVCTVVQFKPPTHLKH